MWFPVKDVLFWITSSVFTLPTTTSTLSTFLVFSTYFYNLFNILQKIIHFYLQYKWWEIMSINFLKLNKKTLLIFYKYDFFFFFLVKESIFMFRILSPTLGLMARILLLNHPRWLDIVDFTFTHKKIAFQGRFIYLRLPLYFQLNLGLTSLSFILFYLNFFLCMC